MRPEILGVSAYGLLLVLALVGWWWTARRGAVGAGLPGSHIDLLAPLIVVAGAVGARAWGLITPADSDGGRWRLFGWVLMGALMLAVYARWHRLPARLLADCFAAPSALAIAIGRIGCFLAGCCWGDVCVPPARVEALGNAQLSAQIQTWPAWCREDQPLAVRFPPGSWAYRQHRDAGVLAEGAPLSLPVHPVQLYEAAAMFLMAGWMTRRCRPAQAAPGQPTLIALGGYAVIRFIMEGFRADNPVGPSGLTFTQWVCLALLATCLGAVVVLRASRRGNAVRPLPFRSLV